MEASSPPGFRVLLRSLLCVAGVTFALSLFLWLYIRLVIDLDLEGFKIALGVASQFLPYIEDIVNFTHDNFSSSLDNLFEALTYPFGGTSLKGDGDQEYVQEPAAILPRLLVDAEEDRPPIQQPFGTAVSPRITSSGVLSLHPTYVRAASSNSRSRTGSALTPIPIVSQGSTDDGFEETEDEGSSDTESSDSGPEPPLIGQQQGNSGQTNGFTPSLLRFGSNLKLEFTFQVPPWYILRAIVPRSAKSRPYRPFDHLPTEILSSILADAVHGRDPRSGYTRRIKDYQFPATAQLVSRRFRNVTLNSPAIWTLVYIKEQSCFDHLALRLSYSAVLDLTVILAFNPAPGGDEIGKAIQASLRSRSAELLRPHRQRIREIHCAFQFFHALFNVPNQDNSAVTNRLKRVRIEPDFSQGIFVQNTWTRSPATFNIPDVTLQVRPRELGVTFVGIRRLCLHSCSVAAHEFIDVLKDQPHLEELAIVRWRFVSGDRTTPRSTGFALPSLRRWQIAEHNHHALGELLSTLSTPQLEEFEIGVSSPSAWPDDMAPPPTFAHLKRLRVSVDKKVFDWLAPSLAAVTEVRIRGYNSGYNIVLKEDQVKMLAKFVQLCTKAKTLVLEDTPPAEVREIVGDQAGKALHAIAVPWKMWGAVDTKTREEFEVIEQAQDWLRENFVVQLWGDGPFGEPKRFVSWGSMQRGVDLIEETIRECVDGRRKKDWIPKWRQVYDRVFDL